MPGRSIAALFTVGRLDLGQAALLQEARDEVRVVGGDALALVLGAARMPSEQPSLGTWGPCSSADLGGGAFLSTLFSVLPSENHWQTA